MTQAAVRAFSKADEAIAMLSFAYPEETLSDSIGARQRVRREIHRLTRRAIAREPMRSRNFLLSRLSGQSGAIYSR